MSPEMLFMLGITVSEDEVSEYESDRLIASAVDAVCGDAGYLVKIALAGVILKRAASPGFPDNAAGVIFGCRQFSDVYLHDFSAEPSDDAFSAVRDAKLGMSPCPEALYFYQSDRADAALRRKSVIFRSRKILLCLNQYDVRKERRRSLFGLSKTSEGVPCSAITPSSMKMTFVEISRRTPSRA